MSWDANLEVTDVDGNESDVGQWGYTHNTNKMVGACLEGMELREYWAKHLGPAWFDLFHGQNVKDTLPILERIVTTLESDPEKFTEMNPINGWGNYLGLLKELKDMLDTARKYPSAKWYFSG